MPEATEQTDTLKVGDRVRYRWGERNIGTVIRPTSRGRSKGGDWWIQWDGLKTILPAFEENLELLRNL